MEGLLLEGRDEDADMLIAEVNAEHVAVIIADAMGRGDAQRFFGSTNKQLAAGVAGRVD